MTRARPVRAGDFRPKCYKSLLPVRVARAIVEPVGHAVVVAVAVDAIRDAVAVTVAAAAVRIALAVPAAALEVPAAVALDPAARVPVHPAALLDPMAPD